MYKTETSKYRYDEIPRIYANRVITLFIELLVLG